MILAGPLSRKGENAKNDIGYYEDIKKNLYLWSSKRVKLIPKFVNAAEILNISNISAMLNYNEGFGNPLIESLGLGIPVIANYEEKFCENG